MAKEKYSILLVDDSEDDRLFIRLAIQRNKRLVILNELYDGEAAIAYLHGLPPFNDRKQHPLPDAVLLDLKMPRKNGFEVLQWLQTNLFERPFVAIVSGSFLPEDIARSLSLGANVYYKKSAFKEERDSMIRDIAHRLDEQERSLENNCQEPGKAVQRA